MTRAKPALGADPGGAAWRVRELVLRSTRSPLPGNRRLPIGPISKAPGTVRAAIGRALHFGQDVTHRMNLEIPPAPSGDVVTLHDLVAWQFPDESAPVAAAQTELQRAAAVICVSEYTAGLAHDLLGVRDPVVVPNGVDERFFDAAGLTADQRRGLGISGEFVLHAGGAAERKNLAALAAAWPIVHRHRPDLTLALAGPEHPRRTQLFDGLPNVRLLGRLDGALVPALVASASAVVVPSTVEGFGLPALEAMAARTALVAARGSALTEVVRDGGLLVDPTEQALATGIIDATSTNADVAAMIERGRQRADGFTWDRSVAGHAQVWRDVASGRVGS